MLRRDYIHLKALWSHLRRADVPEGSREPLRAFKKQRHYWIFILELCFSYLNVLRYYLAVLLNASSDSVGMGEAQGSALVIAPK